MQVAMLKGRKNSFKNLKLKGKCAEVGKKKPCLNSVEKILSMIKSILIKNKEVLQE